MFRNYLAAALRNLARNRLYAAITVAGLALGFAACILMGLLVRDDLSYDQWIAEHQRTYLLSSATETSGRGAAESPLTPADLAAALKLEVPEIEAVARLYASGHSIRRGDVEVADDMVFWADPGIFSVLSVPALAGDLVHALDRPDGIVITRRTARKYFGRDAPIGETLELDRLHPMVVTAVLQDLPSNTHLNTEIVASGRAPFSGLARFDAAAPCPGCFYRQVFTYLRLSPGATVGMVQQGLAAFLGRHKGAASRDGFVHSVSLIALAAVHRHGGYNMGLHVLKPGSEAAPVAAIAAMGGLIAFVAILNFINLMTARAARRATEVGVRKASGAARGQLMVQFIGESLLYVGLGLALAFAIVELTLPILNSFSERGIAFSPWADPALGATILLTALLAGLLAGAYPAFVLSAFRPAVVLKDARGSAPHRGGRTILVILQFSILIALIAATVVIHRQARYALHDAMRLDFDQVVMIAGACQTPFQEAVARLHGVHGAACSGTGVSEANYNVTAVTPDGRTVGFTYGMVDFGLFELLGLYPVAGRFFSADRGADALSSRETVAAAVLNQTAVGRLGFASNAAALGQRVAFGTGQVSAELAGQNFEIIGVVEDFAIDTINHAIQPRLYYVDPRRLRGGPILVKMAGPAVPETVQAVDRLWASAGDSRRPINRFFMSEGLQNVYAGILRQARIITGLSAIAIFIAAPGLFGLAAFTAERRTKEIGIRKAMGAGAGEILRLLLWQFARPVLWANLIAWPAAFFVMRRWLAGFAYHIELQPWMFLAAGGAALAIALVTVAGHSLLVARTRPVLALRYE